MSTVLKKSRVVRRSMTGSEGARKTGAVILEVLAGLRTPTEGSEALGVSSMRYYVMERRALEGMVNALEPRPKGKRHRPEEAMNQLTREKTRLQRELGRMQALVRAAQRTMGLPAPPSREKKKGERRRRRPSVRAMKVVALLQGPDPKIEAIEGREES
ncbi:MAG: hypothetical protein L0191_13850 [Acidobacteria bacterium]|nr:hypothetical protein [Acidobacteriota bacterium]MCI0655835.1 hypothetical protein [Acidobacteriota bacterium]